MRTNYLYFYDGHGFVRNLFDFAAGASRPNHFLKIELIDFLARNRKRVGDARYEGYFSVEYLIRRFVEFGFPEDDILATLQFLLTQGLIVADHLRSSGLSSADLVRVHVSGFVHLRVLGARLDYLSACALVTPLTNDAYARQIAQLWHIHAPRTDVNFRNKQQALLIFKAYLEGEYREFCKASPFFAEESLGTRTILRQIDDVIGFSSGATRTRTAEADFFD